MEIKNILLHLSLIRGLGTRCVYEVINQISKDEIFFIYSYKVSDFVRLGCSQDKAQLFVDGLKDVHILQQELIFIEKHNVQFLTLFCSGYPELLKEIDVPPIVLYCQGNMSLLKHHKTLACVGARKAHRYVYDALKQLVVPMIQDNWIIVSGGALGADTYAHQVTLEFKGKTIVVVGSGLCFWYPDQNRGTHV